MGFGRIIFFIIIAIVIIFILTSVVTLWVFISVILPILLTTYPLVTLIQLIRKQGWSSFIWPYHTLKWLWDH
jgi:hypothetical protein